jgi:hypothetical protein
MIEPEMAFCDLEGDMEVAEAMVKYIIRTVMDRCPDEMQFFNKFIDKGLLDRLHSIVAADFGRVTYTEAIDILKKSGKKFDTPLPVPEITHWLHNMTHDNVLGMLKFPDMHNGSEDKVKLIFLPCYLTGDDGILNLTYYDLVLGNDLCIYPSYYEPWGYTPLEAIAFKVPCITTDLAGFGLWANDYMEATYNHYGIRRMQLFVDDKEVFSSDVSGIPVKQNMQVNAWGDYDHYLSSHVWYMKAFAEPGITLPILKTDEHRGYVCFNEERPYHLCFVLTDYKGNQSRYGFTVEGKPSKLNTQPLFSKLQMLRHDRLNNVQTPGLQLIVRPMMIGKDTPYQPKVKRQPGHYSDAYQLTERSFQLFDYQPLAIRVNRTDVEDPSKLYVVCHWGADKYMGGRYEDGWVWAHARELGATYELDYDDQPPTIHFMGMGTWRGESFLRVALTDSKSGLLRYEATIDGQFVLLEPLPKSNTLECRLRHSSVKPTGRQRTFTLTAEDQRHNRSTFTTQITY